MRIAPESILRSTAKKDLSPNKFPCQNLFLILPVFLFLSCISSPENILLKRDLEKGIFVGKVVDENGLSVPNTEIKLNGRRTGFTDINGKFMFIRLANKKHEITCIKENFQEKIFSFEFNKKKGPNFVHIKMFSIHYFINLTKNALLERDLKEANKNIDIILKMKPEQTFARYCQALVYKEQKEYEKAIQIMISLRTIQPYSKYISLTLADLYLITEKYEKTVSIYASLFHMSEMEHYQLMKKAGEIYEDKLKKPQLAMEYYKKFLKYEYDASIFNKVKSMENIKITTD